MVEFYHYLEIKDCPLWMSRELKWFADINNLDIKVIRKKGNITEIIFNVEKQDEFQKYINCSHIKILLKREGLDFIFSGAS
ncbi:MAG: hypothetical protein KC589_07065 [Nanoarchaeota archaeon]|nr:hypothetical protein [Nanoarchaeota archaeon]